MKLLQKIEQKEKMIKELEADIKYYKKQVGKEKKGYYGLLKLDAKCLIKAIDRLTETKNQLYKLYYKQNKGV